MNKTLKLVGTALVIPGLFTTAIADTATWNGSVDGAWSDVTNWVGPPVAVPGAALLETATFDTLATTLLVDTGALTIARISVNDAAGAFVFGDDVTDTITFENNAGQLGGDYNFQMTPTVANDITIAADIFLGPDDAVNDVNFDVESTNKLVINGNIDVPAVLSGTPGVKRLEFGDFNNADPGNVEFNGTLSNTGAATRIETYVAGADVVWNGTVAASTGNTQRTIIRNASTLTVNAAANVGQGSLEVRSGVLDINTDVQQFDSGLNVGSADQSIGDATVNIGALNTLIQNTGITYNDNNQVLPAGYANQAVIQGGTIQITGANRSITVGNNSKDAVDTTNANDTADLSDPSIPELTITSTITNDGTNRALTIRNPEGGTLLIAPSGAANSHGGGITHQEGFLQLGSGSVSTPASGLTVAARNNAATLPDTVGIIDIIGQTHTVTGLNIGVNSTNLIGDNGFLGSIVDSVGGGLLNCNNINYLDGTDAVPGDENGPGVISADLSIAQNRAIQVQDGEGVIDLTISGDLNASDPISDYTAYGDGTLLLSGTGGTTAPYDRFVTQLPLTLIGSSDPFGEGRVLLQQRANAVFSDFPVVMDIQGNEVTFNENIVLGVGNTANIVATQPISLVDSVGGGVVVLDGSTVASNNINNNAGAPLLNRQATVSADVRIVGTNTNFTANVGADPVDLEISGQITDDNGGGRNITKGGLGVLKLSNTNNLFNVLAINNGTVEIPSPGSLGDNGITLGSNTNDGTLIYTGASGAFTGIVRIGDDNATTPAGRIGAGSILNNGSGDMIYSNNNFNALRNNVTENRTVTLGGSAGNNTIQGVVRDNGAGGGTVGVTKTGSNTWNLVGANTYTGDTDVQAGRLNVNGTVGGNLTVAAGASVGGNATFAGTVTLGAGTELRIDGTNGAITAAGAIDTSAGVNVFIDTGAAGPITVLNYDNTKVNNINVSHFTFAGGVTASFRPASPFPTFVDTGSAIVIDLGFQDRIWDGNFDDVWDIGGTANWQGGDALFYNGDPVTFDDSFFGSGTVDVAAATVPGLMTIASAFSTFTFNGPGPLVIDAGLVVHNGADVTFNGALVGAGALVKQEEGGVNNTSNGRLFLNTANTYSGGTRLEEGSIEISDSAALGTGTVSIADLGGDSPALRLGATGLNVANDIIITNDGARSDITFDPAGTGNVAEISGQVTILETADFAAHFRPANGETLTLSGFVTGPGTPRVIAAGTLVLGNPANNFASRLRIDGNATLSVASIADAGVASHAGRSNSIVLGAGNSNGTLEYTGSGNSTDRQVRIGLSGGTFETLYTGAGAIENNGTGALVFTNAAFNIQDTTADSRVGARTLTLGGSSADANEIQGVIADNAGTVGVGAVNNTVSLTKDGAGTWCLSGTNTYTGDTTVNNGELCFTTSGALPAGADVYVEASAGGVLNLDFAGTVSIGSLFIDGVAVAAGEWGSVGSGAANESAALLGAGALGVTVGGTSLPNITDIAVDGSGNVIITLDGPAAGLSVLQSDDLVTPFAVVASTPSGNTLTVDVTLVDPNADGEDYYQVSE